jgi:hypothetical protein
MDARIGSNWDFFPQRFVRNLTPNLEFKLDQNPDQTLDQNPEPNPAQHPATHESQQPISHQQTIIKTAARSSWIVPSAATRTAMARA